MSPLSQCCRLGYLPYVLAEFPSNMCEAAPLEAAAIAASGLRTSPPKACRGVCFPTTTSQSSSRAHHPMCVQATPLDTAGIGASELSTSVRASRVGRFGMVLTSIRFSSVFMLALLSSCFVLSTCFLSGRDGCIAEQGIAHWTQGSDDALLTLLSSSCADLGLLWQASPQKRKLTPQTVTAPRGRILQSSSSATGVDAVVYLLTTNASLLCQSFPDQYHGYAIAWSSQERNHSTLWQQYLQQEQFTEDSLREEYFVVHRQGPGPMYLRTLLSAGDLSNALSIMENFFLYLKENGHRLEHVRLYNAGDQDLTAWQQDSSLPDLKLLPQEQIPMEFSPLKVGLLERRPDLVLTAVATTEATCYQFRLGGHCWPFRAALGAWHGGFVDGNGDQVAKGSPNSSYARWTPPFPASELKHWLTTLHDTILEVKVIGALEPHVATILSETKFLIIKK